MRLIHNEVAKKVANKVAGVQNVFIKKTTATGKTKRGFLDVYVPRNNSYYEVKSFPQEKTSRTRRQMEKYDNSIAINFNSEPISRGKASADISGEFQYLYYDVTYWAVSDGLVLYNAVENKERKEAYDKAVEGVASLAVTSILASIGIPIPVVV